MKKYIWLNPVVLSLYNEYELISIMKDNGFEVVVSKKNNIDVVKEKYRKEILSSKKCIIDERCPKALEYVKEKYDSKDIKYPKIYPILIHTAIDLSEIYSKGKNMLFIITPCTSLAMLGKSLKIKNATFMTWTDFIKEYSIDIKNIQKKEIMKSPIPPGFFKNYKEEVLSLSGEENIEDAFENELWKNKKIVEMLYCKDGCHNGDGI